MTNALTQIRAAALLKTPGRNEAEAAYRRGDMRQKRRRLMADWAEFCESPPAAKRRRMASQRPAGSRGRAFSCLGMACLAMRN